MKLYCNIKIYFLRTFLKGESQTRLTKCLKKNSFLITNIIINLVTHGCKGDVKTGPIDVRVKQCYNICNEEA